MKQIGKRSLATLVAMILLCGFMPLGLVQVKAATYEGFLWPVPDSRIVSQPYGSGHSGLDITYSSGNKNPPIVAAKSGTVVRADNPCSHAFPKTKAQAQDPKVCGHYSTYGNQVLIRHNDGTYALYGHMLQNIALVSRRCGIRRACF